MMKIWGRKPSPEEKDISLMGIKGRWNPSLKSDQEKKNPNNKNQTTERRKLFHLSAQITAKWLCQEQKLHCTNLLFTSCDPMELQFRRTDLYQDTLSRIHINSRTWRINFWLQVSGAIICLKLLKTTEPGLSKSVLFSPFLIWIKQNTVAHKNTKSQDK